MSVADKLTYLNSTKQAIKGSLQAMGVDITDDTKFRDYSEMIDAYSLLTKGAMFWLDGTIIDINGSKYFEDKTGNGRHFLITGYDFNSDWVKGFPYKSAATISAPAADSALIASDINSYLYTGGTPNQIPVISLFQDVDYEHRLFTRHVAQVVDINGVEVSEAKVVDITFYSKVKTGADLTACQNYFGVPSEITTNVKWVSKTGSDTNAGTKSAPWLTIQKAASTATNGDTIYVKTGIYSEQLDISNKYLSFSRAGTYTFIGIGLNEVRSVDTTRVVRNQLGNQVWSGFYFNGETNTSYIIQAGSSNVKTTQYNRCKLSGATQYLYIGASVETATINSSVIVGSVAVTATEELYGYISEIKNSLVMNAEFRPLSNSTYKNNKVPVCSKNSVIQSSNVTLTVLGNKITHAQYAILSITNATEKVFTIQYNEFNQGNIGSGKAGITIAQAVNVNISRNYFVCSLTSITGNQGFVSIKPNTTLPPTIEYNRMIHNATSGINKPIQLLTTNPVGSAKIRYNYIKVDSKDSLLISINDETSASGCWDGTEIIGNRLVGYKYSTPLAASGASHALLANGGVNMIITRNYISHAKWGIVVKTGLQNAYTSGGVFANLVEDCNNAIWFSGVSAANCFNNTIRQTSTAYAEQFSRGITALENTSQAGDQFSENIICKNNIMDIQVAEGTCVYFDDHAADNGCSITDSVLSGAQYKLSDGAINYATLALAQGAGWCAGCSEINPQLNASLIPLTPIQGVNLGVYYDDGLDASTDWGSITHTPVVVTKQQGETWDCGAYVH